MKIQITDTTFLASVPSLNSTSTKKARAQAIFDTDSRMLVVKTSKGVIRLIPAERIAEIAPADILPYLAMFEKPQPVTKDMKPAKVSA